MEEKNKPEQTKSIIKEVIDTWKQKSGIPVNFTESIESVTGTETYYIFLEDMFEGWKIKIVLNAKNPHNFEKHSCNASKDGYDDISFENMNLANLFKAQPIDKKSRLILETLKLKQRYMNEYIKLIENYGDSQTLVNLPSASSEIPF